MAFDTTVAEYSRHRGQSPKAVRKAIAEGRITAVERDGRKYLDKEIADLEWAKNTRARADSASKAAGQGTGPVTSKKSPTAPDPAAEGVPQYNVTRAKREDVELRRAELLLAEEEKRLIERAPAVTATYTAFRQLRDEAMQVGRRVSARCAGMTDAREIQLLIDEAMRDVLGSFARRTLASLATSLNAGEPAPPPADEEDPHAAG